jgi:hypothetical protein
MQAVSCSGCVRTEQVDELQEQAMRLHRGLAASAASPEVGLLSPGESIGSQSDFQSSQESQARPGDAGFISDHDVSTVRPPIFVTIACMSCWVIKLSIWWASTYQY